MPVLCEAGIMQIPWNYYTQSGNLFRHFCRRAFQARVRRTSGAFFQARVRRISAGAFFQARFFRRAFCSEALINGRNAVSENLLAAKMTFTSFFISNHPKIVD